MSSKREQTDPFPACLVKDCGLSIGKDAKACVINSRLPEVFLAPRIAPFLFYGDP